MRITLTIPDDVAARYEQYAAAAPKPRTLEDALVNRLVEFQDVDPWDRSFLVTGDDRATLERVLGNGHLSGAPDLVDKVARLARLTIGGVEVTFTPPQWEQLRSYASRNRLSLQEYVARIVRQMEAQFFDYPTVRE